MSSSSFSTNYPYRENLSSYVKGVAQLTTLDTCHSRRKGLMAFATSSSLKISDFFWLVILRFAFYRISQPIYLKVSDWHATMTVVASTASGYLTQLNRLMPCYSVVEVPIAITVRITLNPIQ